MSYRLNIIQYTCYIVPSSSAYLLSNYALPPSTTDTGLNPKLNPKPSTTDTGLRCLQGSGVARGPLERQRGGSRGHVGGGAVRERRRGAGLGPRGGTGGGGRGVGVALHAESGAEQEVRIQGAGREP